MLLSISFFLVRLFSNKKLLVDCDVAIIDVRQLR